MQKAWFIYVQRQFIYFRLIINQPVNCVNEYDFKAIYY